MANTFTKIASVTVGSNAPASIDFTSIPSAYTDLAIKVSARKNESGGAVNLQMLLNDSTSGYTQRALLGDGSSASSFSDNTELSLMYVTSAANTANTFNSAEIYITNYTSSASKSISVDSVTENNAATTNMSLMAGLWSNSAAINKITLRVYSPNTLAQYSTFTLYGISKS
jgi:hypothetical protein